MIMQKIVSLLLSVHTQHVIEVTDETAVEAVY